MISLILPYWQRQAAADAALASLARCYPALDLEVIVVDDGSPQPYVVPKGMPWPVRVVRLPLKHQALDPCLPINAGVSFASGDFLALSGAEILHTAPVLEAMAWQIRAHGTDTYVTAACWFPGGNCWHAHSSIPPVVEGVPMPDGAHFHFLAMLHRDLWRRAGGFDADYRAGAGYDDPDWLLRLKRAGARFVLRDDLVVEHQREGARADWPKGAHERNRLLFREKWCN